MYRSQRCRRRFGRAPSRQLQAGYSIYDLLVTSAVAGVLSVGAVSMADMAQDARLTAAVNQLMGDLNLARGEAIRRGAPASLCASATGAECSGTRDWNGGWILFADADGDGEPNPDETVLRIQQANELNSLRFGAWGPGTGRWVTYEADGSTKQNGTFVFCDGRGAAKAKAVILLGTGRPRVSARTSDNKPLKCS